MKKKLVAGMLTALLMGIVPLMGCSAPTKSGSDAAANSSAASAAGDPEAGLAYVKKGCTMCHSYPTPGNFTPLDEEGIVNLLADHAGISVSESDARDIAAYALQ